MAFSEKTVEHREFGRIKVVKSKRARRISISMRPFEPIRLTVPALVSFRKAEEFLETKQRWILQNLEKIRLLEEQYTIFTEETVFRTLEHELQIIRSEDPESGVRLNGSRVLVKVKAGADIRDPGIQEIIRRGIESAWRKEAKKFLPVRLRELSLKYGLLFNKVIIKNNRSRWGSCSHSNNINLSLHLMRLPEHLINYILVHELVHTVHKNHGKYFWRDLERYYPGARVTDRELKGYRIDIY